MSTLIASERPTYTPTFPFPAMAGPWADSNNNVYVILMPNSTSGILKAYKASDPTSSWTEQDGAGRPTVGGVPGDLAKAHSTWQDGDQIHCVWWNRDWFNYEYHIFNTSDHASPDEWQIIEEEISRVGGTDQPGTPRCSIAVRDDGDVIVLYEGATEKIMGSDYDRPQYARREASTWTIDIAVVGVGIEGDFHAVSIGKGESDGMYLTYSDVNNADLEMKFLTSGNTLESTIHVWDADTSSNTVAVTHNLMVWNGETGADEKIYMGWGDNSFNFESNYAYWNGSGFTSGTVRIIATDERQTNPSAHPSFAVDLIEKPGEIFCAYLDTNVDLRFTRSIDGGTWSSSIGLEAGTFDFVSCNIINRGTGGQLLAVIVGNASPETRYLEFKINARRRNLFLNQAVQRASNF